MLPRLAYLGVTNTFALLRLLPMSDRDKDTEILALRHQIMVLHANSETPAHGSPPPTGHSSPPCCTDSRRKRFVDSDYRYARRRFCGGTGTFSPAATQPDPAPSGPDDHEPSCAARKVIVAGRAAFHALTHAFGAGTAKRYDSAQRRASVFVALLNHQLHAASLADRLIDAHRRPVPIEPCLRPDLLPSLANRADALAWFDAGYDNVLAAIGVATENEVHPSSGSSRGRRRTSHT